MKKIFLTGSSGLLGKSLYNLLKTKYRITRITNNIKSKKNRKLNYINFNSSDAIKNFINKKGIPDYFIHAGWGDMTIPNSTYHVKENVSNSKNLVTEFYKSGLKKFLFIGTINEYGNSQGCVKESSNPRGKLRRYEKGKILFGKIGKKISKKYNKIFIHIRLANLYGPIKRENSLIYSIHSAWKKNKDLNVGALDFYRDYMHSDDAALGIKKILERCDDTNVINLGSGKILYMRKFVNVYWNVINKNKKNKINFQKILKKTNNKGYYLDNSKLKKITGWKPKSILSSDIKKNIKVLNS